MRRIGERRALNRVIWLEDQWGHGQSKDPDYSRWRAANPREVERAKATAAEARRWRDLSEIEKLDSRIAHVQQALGMAKATGNADPAAMRDMVERLIAMQAERRALATTAPPSP